MGPGSIGGCSGKTGLIGQVLYLEAEAAGVRATGIGCFFDDPVHRVFGIEDLAFQSLYHFTVGGAVDDPRLTTLAPYGAAATRRSAASTCRERRSHESALGAKGASSLVRCSAAGALATVWPSLEGDGA